MLSAKNVDICHNGKTHFCSHCGSAMTDEAVQMVMERLEKEKDGN